MAFKVLTAADAIWQNHNMSLFSGWFKFDPYDFTLLLQFDNARYIHINMPTKLGKNATNINHYSQAQ
jgi:hypothetical protein